MNATGNRQARRGLTLIELLLYVALASLILAAVSVFFYILLRHRVSDEVRNDVNQEGIVAMALAAQALRNAVSINSPASGSSASSISVQVASTTNNPTVFLLSGGTIQMQEGSGAAIALTSPRVAAIGLNFSNLANSVKITFTLFYAGQGQRRELNYSQNFYGTATIRP